MLDRIIRWARLRKVGTYLGRNVTALDVGCFDGALFGTYADHITRGVGVDPLLASSGDRGRFRFIRTPFPSPMLEGERFDVITMLAVLEHVDDASLPAWGAACYDHLEPGGRVIATVPSPQVDHVLSMLARLRLIDGIEVHQHHGFDPAALPDAFAGERLSIETHRRFELGLNHLFVFTKADA